MGEIKGVSTKNSDGNCDTPASLFDLRRTSTAIAQSLTTPPYGVLRTGLVIQTLGLFTVRHGNIERGKPGNRALRLLTFLLCVEDHSAGKDYIAECLWPGNRHGLNNLHAASHDLRGWLGDGSLLKFQAGEYILDSSDLDADRFESHCIRGRRLQETNPSGGLAEYWQALKLYHGPFIPRVVDLEWVNERRLRLELMFCEAAIAYAEWSLASRNFKAALSLSSAVLEINPAREDAVRARMAALARMGRRSEAVILFGDFKSYLSRELQCRPDPATQALVEQISDA